MATVRIYKVAELLGTTSQEVTALLKRDHGIEVKSASGTIEEVVARQFVDRLARQRNIALPGGDIFAETPAAKGKKGAPAKKALEPPKAVALPPPRLVKTMKPAVAAAAVLTEETEAVSHAEPAESVAAEEPLHEAPPPPVAVDAVAVPEASVDAPMEAAEAVEVDVAPAPVALRPPEPPAKSATAGRLVPPTLRLRIEQERPNVGEQN